MKKHFFLVWALALTTVPACYFDDDGPFHDCEKGQGPGVEVKLDMPEFTGVKLDVEAKVFITQGNDFEVIAKGEDNVIDLLELDVQNDTWEIEFDRCVKDYDLEIYSPCPTSSC
jgi:hypothetical protein